MKVVLVCPFSECYELILKHFLVLSKLEISAGRQIFVAQAGFPRSFVQIFLFEMQQVNLLESLTPAPGF